MKKLVIIAGPTAVGKTNLSIKIAKEYNGEIISADSMQIYKYMDIGSAKVTKEEMENIPHYMINVVHPKDSFDVAQYKEMAENLIDDILKRGKLPIIVGGTGLYIDSIIKDYSFTEANNDVKYREELMELSKEKGNEYVHELLKDVDPLSYKNLHPNNLKRVIRALEIFKLTGKTIGEFSLENKRNFIPKYDYLYFILNRNREALYENINKRVDLMLSQGLIDEVKSLINLGLNESYQSMKGIGYKELISYLDGKISLEEAVYLIKKGSRNYAKRQLTWFKSVHNGIWLDKDSLDEGEMFEEVSIYLKKLLNQN